MKEFEAEVTEYILVFWFINFCTVSESVREKINIKIKESVMCCFGDDEYWYIQDIGDWNISSSIEDLVSSGS